MRALWQDYGFTLSVFFVAATAFAFAVVFSAPPRFVVLLLILGVFTALIEHYLRADLE